jgi:hypothetical protein
MPFQRRRRRLVFSEGEQGILERLRKSRTEQKRRTVRAAILLDSYAGLSDQAIAQAQRVNRNTVRLWITEMPLLWRAGEPTLGRRPIYPRTV